LDRGDANLKVVGTLTKLSVILQEVIIKDLTYGPLKKFPIGKSGNEEIQNKKTFF
jgi:hypothetical protein